MCCRNGSARLIAKQDYENKDLAENVMSMIGETKNQKRKNIRLHSTSGAGRAERKQTFNRSREDQSLRTSEDKFRCLIEALPEGVLFLDAETGTITDANPAIEKMLGYSAGELIDKKFWEIETLKSLPAIQDTFRKRGKKRHFYNKNLLLESKGGRHYRVYFSGTAYQAGNKNVIQYTFQEATDRLRADEIVARYGEELDRLYRASVSPVSSDPFDLQNLAQSVVQMVRQSCGQARCSVFRVQEGSSELNLIASADSDANQLSKARLHQDGSGLVWKAIKSRQVINTPDVRSIPGHVPNWRAARAELTLPLSVRGQVIGAMDVQCALPNAFNAENVRLMSVFAERVTLALEHVRLYTGVARRIQDLASLREIDQAISSSFNIRFTLGVLLDQVIQRLGVDAADVLLFSPVTQTLRYSHGIGFRTQALQHIDLRMDDACAGRAVRERQVITVLDLNKNSTGMKRAAVFQTESFVAYMGAPLIAKGEVRGVLEIFQCKARTLDQEQQAFLEMLAGQAAIAIESAELFENLQASNAELTMAYDETIEGWSHAMDLRDEETEGHTQRVTRLTQQLAGSMGFNIEELVNVKRGALLHDIGKLGVSDAILLKPGPLTDEEWEVMRKHPQFAYDMLAPITYLRRAIEIPYCHHEKWDGTGYPRGLKGEQIPQAARIFAVVDVWDALTSDRPYRKAWSKRKALSYIRAQAGKYFDPQVVEIFLKHLPKGGRDIAKRCIKSPAIRRVPESP